MFAPQPKKRRIVDPLAILRVRTYANNCCEYTGIYGAIEIHHIKTKGAGGDDVEENLIALRPSIHTLVHEGRLSADELRDIAIKRADKIREKYGRYSIKQLRIEMRAGA